MQAGVEAFTSLPHCLDSDSRVSPGRKTEVSSCVSVGACNIGRPPRRGSIVNDQNLLTPAAIAGQLNEGGPV